MDFVYITASLLYASFSLWLLWWFFSTLRVTKRNSAAAIATLGNIGLKLDSILSDLEGVHGRLDTLASDMAALKAGVEAAHVEAAE